MDISSCENIINILVYITVLFVLIYFYFWEKVQPKYIIRRYEKETDLSETKFFQHPNVLRLYMFNNGSVRISILYTFHLFTILVCNDYLFSKLTR